jgi:hypothetical protein
MMRALGWIVRLIRRQVALVSISVCHWSYPTSVFIPPTAIQRLDVEVPGQAVNRRRDFESNGPSSIVFGVTGAGPSPLGRPLAALETDRVLVAVGHRGLNGLHGWEIPIIPSAFLPELKTLGPGPLDGR